MSNEVNTKKTENSQEAIEMNEAATTSNKTGNKIKTMDSIKPPLNKVQTSELNESTSKKMSFDDVKKLVGTPRKDASPDPIPPKKNKGKKEAPIQHNLGDVLIKNNTSLLAPDAIRLSAYNQILNELRTEFGNIQVSFINVAIKIYEVDQNKYYELEDYKNIYDWADDKFHISRGTCNNFKNIIKKFGNFQNGDVKELKAEYRDFTSSQLIPMLSMDEDTRKRVEPSMTVSRIKEIKKESTPAKKKKQTKISSVVANISEKSEDNLKETTFAKDVKDSVTDTSDFIDSYSGDTKSNLSIADAAKSDITSNSKFSASVNNAEEFDKFLLEIKEAYIAYSEKNPNTPCRVSYELVC